MHVYHKQRRRLQDRVSALCEACQSFSFPVMCNKPFYSRADYILNVGSCKVSWFLCSNSYDIIFRSNENLEMFY